MSEEAVVLESKASPEVQAEATAMGWISPKSFRGDPDKFVDAEAYVAKGKEVLPILRATNDRLRGELTVVQAQQRETTRALKEAQAAIENIEERHSVATARAVEKAKLDVKLQLEQASKDGDHKGVAELTDQLSQLNAVDTSAPAKKEEKKEAPAEVVVDPEVERWVREVAPWYGTNTRKTALAMGISQELRASDPGLRGRAFLDRVAEEVEKELGGGTKAAPSSKVEGARNGGGAGGGRSGGAKNYDSLPTEAKSTCDADSRRFVGKDKKYATVADYRENWAKIYHAQE